MMRRSVVAPGSTILIVEDEPPIAAFLADFLQEEGYRTQTARTKAAALHHLTTTLPDLILLDLHLLGGDGVAVVRAIQTDARNAHIPVIILSALHEQVPRELRPHVFTVLPKPVDISVLLRHIQAALPPLQEAT
jgi:DNA-binding response OmpR family regulator